MRPIKIIIVLVTSLFFMFGNAYALNLNNPRDKYFLNNSSLSSLYKQFSGPINVASDNMDQSSPSLLAYNKAYGPRRIIDGFKVNLRIIPEHNITAGGGFNMNDKVGEYLKSHITALSITHITDPRANLNCVPQFLFQFYLHHEFKPVWITKDRVNKKAKTFIGMILKAKYEGLDSNTYHRNDILSLLTHVELNSIYGTFEPDKLAELELLLTDAFFSYGYHLSEGLINPNLYDFDWHIKKPKKHLLKILNALLFHNKLEELVNALQPDHPGYLRLKTALLKYINIKNSGGWPKVPEGFKMRKGDTGKRVAILRSRLSISGDLKVSENSNAEYFDKTLENAVKQFQLRDGLKADGVVGSNTLSALNISVDDRIEQIKLNMERWRWLPRDLGERYIMVNTANFELDVIENGQTLSSSRVVVGKKKRPTPSLSRKITYLELNPYWNIPFKIALKDILPRIRKDPNYLSEKNIRIFEDWTNGAKEIEPESVSWDTVNRKNFVYKLRQDPADSNALGRIKFIFPNEFSIYLHGTPAHELFSKNKRAFSSGCIRIEKPMKLAEYLLKHDPKWNPDTLTAAVNYKKTKDILLSDPMNIHILYWTAWVDQNGVVNFRDDIYGRDRQLHMAMNDKINPPKVLHGKNPEKRMLSFRY